MKALTISIKSLLILAFLGAGIMKLSTPYAEMLDLPKFGWAEGYSAIQVSAIALVEITSALILLVSLFKKSFNIWAFVAGIVLILDMTGAIATHVTREEPILLNVVLLILALSISLIKFIEFNRS